MLLPCFAGDTIPLDTIAAFAKGSDVVIHETVRSVHRSEALLLIEESGVQHSHMQHCSESSSVLDSFCFH